MITKATVGTNIQAVEVCLNNLTRKKHGVLFQEELPRDLTAMLSLLMWREFRDDQH